MASANPRPRRPCAAPGCTALTRTGYCDAHADRAAAARAEAQREYDETRRDARLVAFYRSTAWHRARDAARMRDHGLCQDCLQRGRVTLAETVHHVVPIRQAWHMRLTLDNLTTLCAACHAARHGSKCQTTSEQARS